MTLPTITFPALLLDATGPSFHIRTTGDDPQITGTEALVPKSLVTDNKDGTFTMPVWLAKDRGFLK